MDGPDRLHPDVTHRRGLRYQLTQKHHQSRGRSPHRQWLHELTDAQEFDVFDSADTYVLEVTPNGDMYGLARIPNGSIREIGSREEHVAFFWAPSAGNPWHGFPVSGVEGDRPYPPSSIWDRIAAMGLATDTELGRIRKGRRP